MTLSDAARIRSPRRARRCPHHRTCGGDCTVGGYFSFEKANLGLWNEVYPEWSYEIYELEVKARWDALDEDGKKVFGRKASASQSPSSSNAASVKWRSRARPAARATVCVRRVPLGSSRRRPRNR